MRLLCISILFAVSIGHLSAQTVPQLPYNATTESVEYGEVVQVDGTSQAVLFDAAQAWAIKTYKNYKAVLQSEDKESGKIIIKPTSAIYDSPTTNLYQYILTIECKPNRVRYRATDINAGYSRYGAAEALLPVNFLYKMCLDHQKKIAELPKQIESSDNRKEKKQLSEDLKKAQTSLGYEVPVLSQIDRFITDNLSSLKKALLNAKDF